MPIKADDHYLHFQRLDTLPKETVEFFLKQLLVGEAALKYSFSPQGTALDRQGSGTALEEIMTKALDMVAKGIVKTRPQAIAKIVKEDPALGARYQTELRAKQAGVNGA